MEFESNRFVGDQELFEILNSGDTGLRKLGTGQPNPPDAVLRVQQALWDLFWAADRHPGIHYDDFVDGDFGPKTYDTALDYKAHYDIRFPPGDPGGLLDGNVGPRTLARLDVHCVHLDRGTEALLEKHRQLTEAGVQVDLAVDETEPQAPLTRPITETTGTARQIFLPDDTSGHLYYRDTSGAHMLYGDFEAAWLDDAIGGPRGRLGFPATDQAEDETGTTGVIFEGGSLTWSPGGEPGAQYNEDALPGSWELPERRF